MNIKRSDWSGPITDKKISDFVEEELMKAPCGGPDINRIESWFQSQARAMGIIIEAMAEKNMLTPEAVSSIGGWCKKAEFVS